MMEWDKKKQKLCDDFNGNHPNENETKNKQVNGSTTIILNNIIVSGPFHVSDGWFVTIFE